MPRGNRHHLPGYVWHITSRCHRRQFLLRYRTIHDLEGMLVLREEAEAYKQVFGGEIPRLGAI